MKKLPGNSPYSNTGFALIAVLWLLVLLTVIAAGLAYSSRLSTQSLGALTGGTQARYLGDGAAQLVTMNLLSRNPSERLLGDGETITLTLPGGTAEVTVIDENGKIDLNAAKPNLLARLLYALDVEQSQADALADAIADFRDEDDLTRLNGAEDNDYLSAGLEWEAKDAPFTSLDELQQVLGMEPEIFKAMQPFITLHSRHQGINPEVAALKVLMAVSDDSEFILQNYIEQRRANHNDGLPLPLAPSIGREFLSRTRGVTYLLSVSGRTEGGQVSGITTTIRLRRGRNRLSIETLDWRPYLAQAIASQP